MSEYTKLDCASSGQGKIGLTTTAPTAGTFIAAPRVDPKPDSYAYPVQQYLCVACGEELDTHVFISTKGAELRAKCPNERCITAGNTFRVAAPSVRLVAIPEEKTDD